MNLFQNWLGLYIWVILGILFWHRKKCRTGVARFLAV